MIVAGVSFEKSAFEASDLSYKSSRRMLIVTFWRETQIFKRLYLAMFLFEL
jgi:hypothetical protein